MKFLGTCSKVISVGFATAFVISALIALLLVNLQNHYLNPDTYKTVLDEQNIYDRLPAILSKQIAYSITYNPCLENPEQCEGEGMGGVDENNGPPTYLKNLTIEDWELMLSHILTPEWTKSQTESVLDQFFAFLNSEEEKLSITISLVGLKANLTGQKGMEFMRILVDAQPPCTETLLGLLLDAAAGDFTPDQLLLCRPPEEVMDGLAPTLEAALDLVIDDLPDQAILGKKLFGGGENASASTINEGPGINFQTVRSVMRLSLFLPLIFLVLLTLFGVRSWRGFLFWWGIPFMILGISALGVGLIALPMLDWGLGTFVLDRIPGAIDPDLLNLLIDSTELLVQSFVRVIVNQAALIVALGIIMTGAGLIVNYTSTKKA
ncbi:MAG: hypothetical protein A2Z14_09475 [Chloroflexi bacterium RBG_16_48_8]|nr:MAG: hypothetical protein A2Z14_09475 [Chloroflexi bacterium RBG_16_48_8]